jgi:Skp family chaperone for outer membrane proteins
MRPLHVLLCLTAAFTLSAQESAPRIGMLVPDRIIENTSRGRRLFSELEALKKTLGERIQAKRAEIQKLSGQLQSPSISDAGKETIQKQLRDLDFEEKKLQDDSQMEFQRTQQRVVTQFQQELSPLVEELAKEQKLSLVLTWQPGLVAFVDQNWLLTFTDEVGRRYDAKYPASAPLTPPPGAAAPRPPAAGTAAPKPPAPRPAAPKPAPAS